MQSKKNANVENTSPDAKASRLRKVRNLANLSRKEMCGSEINEYTYKQWEIAKYTGLSEHGAGQIVIRVAREGVKCTAEWLMTGEGTPPYVIDNNKAANYSDKDLTEEQRIMEEFLSFSSYYDNAVMHEVSDDAMQPIFDIGDVVAGVQSKLNDTNKLHNEICLVQLSGGGVILRRVLVREDGQIMLVCLNLNTSVGEPVIYQPNIAWIARVIWSRKKLHSKGSDKR